MSNELDELFGSPAGEPRGRQIVRRLSDVAPVIRKAKPPPKVRQPRESPAQALARAYHRDLEEIGAHTVDEKIKYIALKAKVDYRELGLPARPGDERFLPRGGAPRVLGGGLPPAMTQGQNLQTFSENTTISYQPSTAPNLQRINSHNERAFEDISKLSPQEQEKRLAALIGDRQWRMENMYMILDEDAGMVPLVLREEQRQFLHESHNRNFVPKARKLGMSTIIVLLYMDMCLFPEVDPSTKKHRQMNVGLIDLKEPDAWAKLAIARFAWENGPKHPVPAIAAIWSQLHQINPLVTDNNGTLKWTNGCTQTAGVSYTGKTPQALHVSELGPIAAQFPNIAKNIVRGSFNAVTTGGRIDVETTMEGGRMGECYKLFQSALRSAQKHLTSLDWKLHFFSSLNHPSYRLPGSVPTEAGTFEYFAKLTQSYGPRLHALYGFQGGVVPLERQAWWEKKKAEQGEFMNQQFPSVIEECDSSTVAGRIYPEFTGLRAQGRIKDFNLTPGLPLYVAADLGSSANTALWLIQPSGRDLCMVDCAFGEGAGAAWVANQVRAWEREFDQEVVQIMLPHDARITDKGSGITYVQNLINAGIPARCIQVVPRTPDVWQGIEQVRRLLPNMWFHTRCDQELPDPADPEKKHPGGVARLEGYRRTKPANTGTGGDQPLGDICSHAADGLRTWAEGNAHHLVRKGGGRIKTPGDEDYWPGENEHEQKPRVLMGMEDDR